MPDLPALVLLADDEEAPDQVRTERPRLRPTCRLCGVLDWLPREFGLAIHVSEGWLRWHGGLLLWLVRDLRVHGPV